MFVVLVKAEDTPNVFGVGHDEDTLYMISECCKVPVDYNENVRTAGLPGSGVAAVECRLCKTAYRGYSDTDYPLDGRTVADWIQTWTGLKDVTVDVKY